MNLNKAVNNFRNFQKELKETHANKEKIFTPLFMLNFITTFYKI